MQNLVIEPDNFAFTIYRKDNGEILCSGDVPQMQYVPPHDAQIYEVLWGIMANPETEKIVDGKPVPWTKPITDYGEFSAAVFREMNRRKRIGFKFNTVWYQGDDASITNMTGLGMAATSAVINGAMDGDYRWSDPLKDFVFIARDNSMVPLDARTMMMLGQAAMNFSSSYAIASRKIKDRFLAGETLTITDDALWPKDQTV